MRISGIIPESIVDGPGLRWVLFVQGCPHGCHGCHNPQTWGFDAGTEMTVDELLAQLDRDWTPIHDGITISGGEPFAQQTEVADLIRKAGKHTVVYTGYEHEVIRDTELARLADVLIVGPYIDSLRTVEGRFYGSSNQKYIVTANND